jgi:hypothetical protein
MVTAQSLCIAFGLMAVTNDTRMKIGHVHAYVLCMKSVYPQSLYIGVFGYCYDWMETFMEVSSLSFVRYMAPLSGTNEKSAISCEIIL